MRLGMGLGLGNLLSGASGLAGYVLDNLKLYLDFTSSKSDTLKFPSEGSTEFSGSNQYIDCGNGIGNQLGNNYTGDLTISMWIKADATFTEGIFGIGAFDGTYGDLYIRLHGNALQFYLNNNWRREIAYTDTGWNHIACVYKSGSESDSKLYVNGISVGSTTGTFPSASDLDFNGNKTTIGAYFNNTKDFDGKMANVAVWSRCLEPEEIQSIQNKSYSQLKGVEETSLVAWWALDNAVLGDELIADGDFSSSDNWTESSGWTIDTTQGKAIYVPDGTNSYRTMPYTNATLNTLAEYEVTITIDSCSNFANCGIVVGNAIRNFSPSHVTSTGTTTFSVVIGRADLQLWSQNASITISNISVKEKNVHTDSKGSNNGVNIGATTTTSVYGGNAPILPRAVDVAKEGQADNIGNGSASFNGSTDIINFGSDSLLDNIWNGKGTLTAWIYPKSDGEGNAGRIAEKRDDGNGWTFHTDQESSGSCKLKLFVNYSTTNGQYVSGADVTINAWNHIALTYDTSGAGSSYRPTIYINGFVSTLSSTNDSAGTADSDASEDFTIGGNKTSLDRCFDGLISQVGLWQGSLTQSQVQEVLESTSYSKIPADVKSTLGSNLVDANTSSGWFDNGDGSTITNITDGVSIADDSGFSDIGYFRDSSILSTDLTVGKLYKVQVDAFHNGVTTIELRIRDGSANQLINLTTTNTTYTRYIVAQHATDGSIRTNNHASGSIAYLTNLSVKEVTNDIVAYYPLDGDSSRGNGTDDATTGEVLGSELFTNGWTNDGNGSSYPPYSGSFSYDASANTVTATSGSSGTFVGNETFRTEFTAVANALYKITFTTSNTVSSVQLRGLSSANHLDTQTSTPYLAQNSLGDGSQVFYLKANASATRYIGFRSGGTNRTITVSNFSIKQVTSNTGVLL